MNDSLEVLKKIYKPYKYTLLNKCTMLESTSGNIVVKKKGNVNIGELYSYLNSRGFTNYPKLIEDNRDDINVFEYINDVDTPIDQKSSDLINLISSLHNKTSFTKEVTEDKYKEIYENILANILYKEKFYNDLIEASEDNVFPSPAQMLLLTNSFKIFESIEFCKKELEEWYSMVSNVKEERVSLIHNNLKLDHYLRNVKDYLISWDKACIDTPILDLVNFYRSDMMKINFGPLLKKYLSNYSLNEHELKLFFILIVMPDLVDLNKSEFVNVKQIRTVLDYIFKTEELVRPYYSKEEKE